MNTLLWIVDGSFSSRLTVTLLHFLWQGCASGIAVIVGGRLLRGAPAHCRYSLNVGVMMLMAVCLPVTFCMVELPNEPADHAAAPPLVGGSKPSNFVNDNRPASATAPIDSSMPQRPAASESVAESNSVREAIAIPMARDSSAPPRTIRDTFPASLSADTFQTLSRCVTILYLAGVTLILGRLLQGVCGGRRLRKMASTINDDALLEIVRNLAHRLGLKVAPAIAWCDQISIPVVVGIVEPMILLPVAIVSGLTPNQLHALLLHEMAHIRRFDPIVNLCQRMIEAVLFFHPMVWFVSRRISVEREHAADDIVLAAGWDRPVYADALVRVAELASAIACPSATRRATVLGASGSSPTEFKLRVLRLLDDSPPPQLVISRAGILMTVLFVAMGGMFAWSQHHKNPANPEHQKPAAAKVLVAEELKPFQGIWRVSLCDSETTDLNAPQEISRHMRWIIKGNEITWIRPGRAMSKLTFKIDPTKSPKEIDLTFLDGPHKGQTCLAMYEWGGIHKTSLNISMQDPGAKVARPQSISMQGGGQTSLIFLDPIDHKYELGLLQGRWSIKVESDAWPRPIGGEQEQQWLVQGNKISWTSLKGEEVKASFTIDPEQTPKQINLTFLNGPDKGQTCRGIYDQIALAKKPLWMCLTNPGADATRPSEFKYEAAAGRALIRLDPNQPRVPDPIKPATTTVSQDSNDAKSNVESGRVAVEIRVSQEREPLMGTWAVDSCKSEAGSLKVSEWDARRWRWTVKGNEITWGREGQEWNLNYKVDPVQSPKQVDLMFIDGPHKGETCLGIYERTGDEGKNLRIRIQDPGAKVARPADFAWQAGSQTSLIALRSIPPIDPVKELASFQGTWCWDFSQLWTWPQPIGVGTDSNGRKSEKRWVIEGNRITWVGRDGQRVYVNFTIDPFKVPKQIEFTFLNGQYAGKKSIGIYEPKNGDENNLWLCMTDPGSDAPRPTDISAGSFKKQSMISVYKVVAAAKPSAANELRRLQGVWQMELCDSTNQTLHARQKEVLKWQWTIKDDEILWSRQGDVWKLSLHIDRPKTPREMDLTFLTAPFEMDLTYLTGPFKGAKCQGIFGWGGVGRQSLMIAIQDPGSDAPRPTKFHMNSAVKTGLMILRPSKPSDAEREIAALQGSWTLRNFETGNFERNKDPSSWPLPGGKGPDNSGEGSELRWNVKQNEIAWTSPSGQEIKASFTIEPDQSPKQIDLTFLSGPDQGKTCPGIYQRGDLDENILWICVADPDSTKGRPKEFSYGWNEGRSLLSFYPFEH